MGYPLPTELNDCTSTKVLKHWTVYRGRPSFFEAVLSLFFFNLGCQTCQVQVLFRKCLGSFQSGRVRRFHKLVTFSWGSKWVNPQNWNWNTEYYAPLIDYGYTTWGMLVCCQFWLCKYGLHFAVPNNWYPIFLLPASGPEGWRSGDRFHPSSGQVVRFCRCFKATRHQRFTNSRKTAKIGLIE